MWFLSAHWGLIPSTTVDTGVLRFILEMAENHGRSTKRRCCRFLTGFSRQHDHNASGYSGNALTLVIFSYSYTLFVLNLGSFLPHIRNGANMELWSTAHILINNSTYQINVISYALECTVLGWLAPACFTNDKIRNFLVAPKLGQRQITRLV